MLDNMVSISSIAVSRIAVIALTQLSELFSCFNPWVITPSVNNNGLGTWFPLDPIVVTLLYAILEPLGARDLLDLEVPPWTLLLGLAPLHMIWTLGSMDLYTALRSRSQQSKSVEHWKSNSFSKLESGRLSRNVLQQICIAVTFVIPVITSTVLNASMLLFSHSLYAPSVLESPWILLQTSAAIFFFLFSRFADYVICKQARRGRSIGTAVLCQILLIGIRAYTRTLIGATPFAAFQIPNPEETEQKFGSGRYPWKKDPVPHTKFLATWWWVLTFTSGSMMLAGRYLILQGIKDQAR